MRTLLGLLFLVFSISSRAESYCVADTAQLLAAVAAANASPQDSVIRLQTGNYSLTGQAIGAAITISGTSGLQLIGGHAPGCAVLPTATNAELTSLFVNNERRLMDIIFSSNSLNDVTVSSLNFSLGVSNSVDAAGCVTVTDAGGLGTLRIINTGFYGCRTLGPGSALNFESKSVNLELKSSEFANNISGNGAIALVMQNDATFHIANLTVSGNTNTNNITGVGG